MFRFKQPSSQSVELCFAKVIINKIVSWLFKPKHVGSLLMLILM